MSKSSEPTIEDEVVGIIKTESALMKEVNRLEDELREVDARFQLFIEKQAELKLVQTMNAQVWKSIEKAMIDNDIKSVKGTWGSITLVERTNYAADIDLVPSKFIKKMLDTTKVAASHKLEGKLPKGVSTTTTKYIQKRFKKEIE